MTAINLANVRNRQHDPAEARRLLQEAYDGLSAQDGEDDPTVLGARYLLATIAAQGGDLEGALADLEAVLRTRERVLGPDHPETMWTRVSLAAVLEEQGDVRRAEEIYRDSIERRQRVLGDGHTDTARSRSQLADLLVKNPARQQEARPLLEAALSTYQEVLGEENLRTHDARVLLALLAERRGDHPEADRQLRTALGHGFDRSVLDGLGEDVRADLLAVAARVDPVAE
jgi:tetratricopeptide (TPR) repeat protein